MNPQNLACAVLNGLALLIGGGYLRDARAATLEVNSAGDGLTADADCNLREAVVSANTDADGLGCVGVGSFGIDTITFANSMAAGGTITLGGTQLDVTDSLRIDGSIGVSVTISGNSNSRIIESSADLALSTLTLEAGNAGGGNGGAVRVSGSGVSLVIENSLIRNSVAARGGGVSGEGTDTVINSVTFNANTASISGGGAFQVGGSSSLTDVTFAAGAGTGSALVGGSATLMATNTVFAGPTPVCSAFGLSASTSFSEDGTCGDAMDGGGAGSAQLAMLGDNGGPTLTHGLELTSPLRDTGSGCLSTDQRGDARPKGGTCDIGALEAAPGEVPVDLSAFKVD